MKLKSPFSKSVYEKNAQIYRMMAHPLRLEILNLLKGREVCVDDMAKVLEKRKANISQHLALLRYSRVVSVRKEGQHVFYSLADPAIVEPCRIFRDLWKKREKNGDI
ncbi:MAG: metalloregulator ArsR/SmtB family transcription factor [bacterium]|nr:metalloregulator ArsR/SmtB family transcription factor [bacterium]